MVLKNSDAVFRPVLNPKESGASSRQCTVVVVNSEELRQELSGSVPEVTPRRCIFEIVAPDGRSLVSLERAP